MTDRGDGFLGALPAARTKRIGSNVHIRSIVILVRQPAEVTRCKRLLQRDDTLLDFRWGFHSEQEGDRRARSEAAGEKVFSSFWHRITPQHLFRERDIKGLAVEEVRLAPDFQGLATALERDVVVGRYGLGLKLLGGSLLRPVQFEDRSHPNAISANRLLGLLRRVFHVADLTLDLDM